MSMSYLDVRPMISALNHSPDQFAFKDAQLRHLPSGHAFQFDRHGRVTVEARCDCTYLEVSREQEPALYHAYTAWHQDYWRPLQINTQFAAHFMLPLWRRALIALTGRLHRALLKGAKEQHEKDAVAVPAE